MKSNWIGGRPLSLAGTVVGIAWAGVVGLCLWIALGPDVRMLVALPALVLTASLGAVWRSRVRAAKRNAVLETYAAREIARTRRLPAWK